MRNRRLGAVLLAAAFLAACGEGRAIFNVDVLSFIRGEVADTLPYLVPGGASGTTDMPAVEVSMLGLAAEELDSVTVTLAADVENASGDGSVSFQIFFSPDSLNTYQPGNLYVADTAVVSGADTATLAPPPVVLVGDTLFANSTVWVGVRAGVNATTTMTGKVRLTQLDLRIVADVSSQP
jgi:hypothetical protein